MVAILAAAGIIVMLLTCSIAYYKRDIVELIVLGLAGFCCVYVLVGGVLFWIDRFSILTALSIELAVLFILLAVTAAVVKRRPTAVFHYRDSLIPLAVFAVAFIVIYSKFGCFGMGQDQGVYQMKALALINGVNDNYLSFDEYNSLTNEEDIADYEYEAVHSLVGFYRYDPKTPALDEADFPDKMTGVMHGVPTYASLLALYGTLSGYSRMADIQTWFMFIGLYMMYCVMRNLRINKKLRFAGLLVYASSPIVLWTAKATLTEMFIFVLLMLYLYFMTDRRYPQYICLSFVPLVVFAFFHITIYTIMPMLVIIYFTLYYMTRDKQYAWANLWLLAGYLAGFFMMRECATVYTYGNYKKIFVLGINENNLTVVVTAVVLLCAAITLALILIPMERQERFRETVTRGIRKHLRLVVRILLIISIAALVITFMNTKMRFTYSTFYAYILSSGILSVIFLFMAFLYRPQFITAHKDHLLLTIMFVYMVIMYSCIFKPMIASYYYYARYIVPYVSIIVILTMLRLSRVDAKVGAGKYVVPIALAVLYFVLMLPNNIALASQKDITNMDWQIIEDVASKLDESDAVIIDSELAPTLKFPVKILAGADVYPAADDIREQIARLEDGHSEVYYITTTEWFLFKNYDIDNVYSAVNEIWYDISETNESRQNKGINPFPVNFERKTQTVNLYRCHSNFD